MLDQGRFALDAFKRSTNIKGKWFRGSNMQLVDDALEAYWQEVRRARSSDDQTVAAYQVLKACNTWLKYKKDKFNGGEGKEHFKTRWDEVAGLAKAAFYECQFGSTGVSAGAVRFEQKKLNAAWSPTRSLKALDAPYAHERAQWENSNKKKGANPISGTSLHETMDRITKPSSTSDQKLAGKFGQKEVFAKNFDQLTLNDWTSIDRVMAKIEREQKSTLSRHVLFIKKADRIEHIAIIRQGKLTKEDGSFWHTGTWQEVFVMDEYGNLFIGEGSLGTSKVRLNHSSMLAGKAVLCAGTLSVEQGFLTAFNNNSGHYKPTGEHVYQALQALRDDRTDFSKTEVIIASAGNHGWGPLKVDEVTRYRGVLPANHPKAY